MKCIHTFGTDRHKRHADITFLFEYTSVLKAQPGHCISNIYIYLYVSYQSVHTGGSGWGGGGGGVWYSLFIQNLVHYSSH